MQIKDVLATVALGRMWIYARGLSTEEKETLSRVLLAGHSITYTAFDTFDNVIDHTTVTPQNFPVTLVTEDTF